MNDIKPLLAIILYSMGLSISITALTGYTITNWQYWIIDIPLLFIFVVLTDRSDQS
jgi:hypothetical protein